MDKGLSWFVGKIKIYLQLFLNRDWWGINYRLQFLFRRIDLSNVCVDELKLSAECAHDYADSGGPELEAVLDNLEITPRDAIIDFGCGKGGALITLAKFSFSKITGVEISTELIDIARRNLSRLRLGRVTIEYCDATEFNDLDGYNYFYFFSPFPCPVMQSVIKNIAASLARQPREVTIIYLNPECHDVVVADTPFVKRQEFEHPTLRYYIYSNIG